MRVELFFSSRRRHTRLQGDWSSDVCSSDLCARQLLIPHPELLTDDLLELHPAPFAHAWPRTQHSAAPSSPLRPAAMPAPLTPSSPLPAAGPSKPLCTSPKRPHLNPTTDSG